NYPNVNALVEYLAGLLGFTAPLAPAERQASAPAARDAGAEPIAIIGLGCRLPGGADDPEAFWRLLDAGTDAIGEVPPDRWDVDAYHDPDPGAVGKISTRHGGFLSSIDRFDP